MCVWGYSLICMMEILYGRIDGPGWVVGAGGPRGLYDVGGLGVLATPVGGIRSVSL